MFFPERIVSIKAHDRVLEVGPGGTPHARSDVLLERIFASENEYEEQRGKTPPLSSSQKIVFYDGTRFPFQNGEFDYVICSHVLEHVDDVDAFVQELTRVARRGYLEYPTVYYDYLYNFKVHQNFLLRVRDKIFWMPKANSHLQSFFEVQKFFYQSLVAGHEEIIIALKPFFFEGFEWFEQLKTEKTSRLEDVCMGNLDAQQIRKKCPPICRQSSLSPVHRIYQRLRSGFRRVQQKLA